MRVAEIGAWWLVLTGLWVVTLSAPSTSEVLAGAVSAALCAVAGSSARRAMRGSWRPRLSWLRWFGRVPATALRESAAAIVTVFRRPSAGRFTEIAVPEEPTAVHEARLAVAVVAIGCTPAAMVVTSPPDEHTLVVHRLLGDSVVLGEVRR